MCVCVCVCVCVLTLEAPVPRTSLPLQQDHSPALHLLCPPSHAEHPKQTIGSAAHSQCLGAEGGGGGGGPQGGGGGGGGPLLGGITPGGIW
eukprot:COSAG05_NODE_9422_length_623_cov_1.502857_2_plen_90_part_01